MALRIKDSVDLKELEKFGFKHKYDEDTGEIKAYEKVLKETEYRGLLITFERTKSRIRIFKDKQKIIYKINPYNYLFDVDTLYDLIQARFSRKGW